MNKTTLILLSGIDRNSFFHSPIISNLQNKGVTLRFCNFIPLEPKSALSYVLAGCNPGKTGFLNIDNSLSQFKESDGFDKTILFLLSEKGVSIEYLINNLPTKDADFSFLCLSKFQLLEKILNSLLTNGNNIFLVAPVFDEYVEKSVNVNNFLREREIIETNDNGEIIWENSLAYQKEYGHLWINLIGRDPKGAVSPGEEYEEVREALIGGITKKLVDNESGQHVVDKVYRKEELFSGAHFLKMPDLIVTLRQGFGFANLASMPFFSESTVFKKKTVSYVAGAGIILGENISGASSKEVSIASIAPSLLYSMGWSIPLWMDGKIEETIFKDDFILSHPPHYEYDRDVNSLTEVEEALIAKKLKDLGYIG